MKRLFNSIILLATICIFCDTVYAQDEPKTYGWSFVNFGTPVLSWDIYRNTMFGIPQDSSGVTAPFDWLFYDLLFKTQLGAGGNCFGLSLLSLVMNKDGGHLGYCCPTNFYGGTSGVGPTDPKLTRAINIMHGHQVTLASLQYFFEQIISGHSQNATFVTPLIQQTLDKEGPFLISITKDLSPTNGGHTLIGYKLEHLGGSHYKLYVVDVNRIWADSTTPDQRDFYTSGNNYIDCNGATWKYNMGGSLGYWPSGQGHLTVLPETVAAPTGRVPSSLGLAVGALTNKIFIAHDGEHATINQIRNSDHKRLFIPGSKEIDWDMKTGMRTIAPWFPSASLDNKPFKFETYFNFGDLKNAEVDFYSGTKGAKVALGDNRGYVLLNCKDADATATLSVSGLGTANPVVEIKNVSKSIVCDLVILIATKAGETNRTYSLKDVEIPAGTIGTFACSITNARNITISGASPKGLSLVVKQESTDQTKEFSTNPIFIVPSDKRLWNEETWMSFKKTPEIRLLGK